MQSAYGNLKQLIRICSMKQNIHICIHDISGILQTPQLAIPYENTMHSKNFCNTAKSTAKGYGLCITCKVLANKKALKDRKLFYGHCPFGLFEIACPVILNDETIVYVGNLRLLKKRHTENYKVHVILPVFQRKAAKPDRFYGKGV